MAGRGGEVGGGKEAPRAEISGSGGVAKAAPAVRPASQSAEQVAPQLLALALYKLD